MALFAPTLEALRGAVEECPPVVRTLWDEASSMLPLSDSGLALAITFGSLPARRFSWLVISDRTYVCSDFEFALVTDGEPTSRIRALARTAANTLNARHARNHLGFYVSANTQTPAEFLAALSANEFYRNHVIGGAVVLAGAPSVIGDFLHEIVPVPITTLQRIVKTRLEAMVLELTPLAAPSMDLYDAYAGCLAARSVLKLAWVSAAYFRGYDDDPRKAVPALAGVVPVSCTETLASAARALQARDVHRLRSRGFANSLARAMDEVLDAVREAGSDQAGATSWDEAAAIARDLLLAGRDGAKDRKLQRRQESFVARVLPSKGDHYDYFRTIHAVT